MNYKMLTIMILSGLVVLFIVQNVAVVEIQFLFWSTQMPRSLMMFLLLAIGILIGSFLHSHLKHREREPK